MPVSSGNMDEHIFNPPQIQKVIVEHVIRNESTTSSSSQARIRTFSGRVPRPNGEVDYETWRTQVDLLSSQRFFPKWHLEGKENSCKLVEPSRWCCETTWNLRSTKHLSNSGGFRIWNCRGWRGVILNISQFQPKQWRETLGIPEQTSQPFH